MKNLALRTACGLAWMVISMQSAAFAAPSESRGPELSNDRVILHTNIGDIAFAFYPKVAPLHTAQIRRLVSEGRYNGTIFFHVFPGFLAQVASLGPNQGIKTIPAEFSDIVHRRGLLSMARNQDDINSADSSFSIMFAAAPQLDKHYTIFGEVVAGQEVLNVLEQVPIDSDNKPESVIRINQAEIVDASTLASIHLQGPPATLPASPETFKVKFANQNFSLAILGTIFALSLIIVVFSTKLSARTSRSLVALIVLLSGFGLFALLTQFASDNPGTLSWAALAAFFGAFVLFRVMGRFEPTA